MGQAGKACQHNCNRPLGLLHAEHFTADKETDLERSVNCQSSIVSEVFPSESVGLMKGQARVWGRSMKSREGKKGSPQLRRKSRNQGPHGVGWSCHMVNLARRDSLAPGPWLEPRVWPSALKM